MDAPLTLIASTVIENAIKFPISYKLNYTPSDIKPHHTYSMAVRIYGSSGELLFINDAHIRADFTSSLSPTIDIPVIRGNHYKIVVSLFRK